jgi:predicted DNA-binding transcriptional regulator YafY
MRLDRLLAIVITLLNKDIVQAKDLAEKHEVSIRTIYRDIEAINQAGIPIVTYQGNTGGLSIAPNYRIDRQVLTLQDMQSILLALKGLQHSLPDKNFANAYEKIASLATTTETKLSPPLDIDLLPWGYAQRHQDTVQKLYQAIVQHHEISFSYRKTSGEKTERTVEPITLLFKGFAWYLVGYCRLRKDFRLFKITRITHLNISHKTFIPKEFSLKDMNKEQNIPLIPVELRFKPQARALVEEYFALEYIHNNPDQTFTVKTKLPQGDWLIGMLLGHGENIEVLKPVSLRKEIQQKIQAMTKLYQT